MNTKVLKVCLGVVLAIGSALSVGSVRADYDPYNQYDCVGNVCVGDTVAVVAGHWVGHAGLVVGADDYNNTLTVLNSSGYYLYPSIHEVRLQYDGRNRYCAAEFCVGDRIAVVSGYHRGVNGRIVGTNDRYYEVTILSDRGQYITVSISDIYLLQRGTQPGPRPIPNPRPRPNPYCGPGYVWDHYLQRCIAVRPVPRPIPRPVPPRPVPRPVPRPIPPGPRPVPRPEPRPVPRPAPGPRPGHCPPGTHMDPVLGRCVR